MTEYNTDALDALCKKIEYVFVDIELLQIALTHTSYVKGDLKGTIHNERLEFLGDAVLELVISEELYTRYPDWGEGAMTRARADIVCEPSLDTMAREHIGLENYLRLGYGEENTGGRDKPSIVSDALEAVIGAIYLDGGLAAARTFILRLAHDALEHVARSGANKDYKTALQEYVQKRHMGQLQYALAGEKGPDHKKEFAIQVLLDGRVVGEGRGNSKQEAGQQAAQAAFEMLKCT